MTTQKISSKKRQYVVLLVVGIVSFVAGTRYHDMMALLRSGSTDTLDLSSVQETYRALQSQYDGQLDQQALIHGANRGLTEAAGDEHTSYFDPEESEEFDKSLNGDIGGGIGAQIGLRNQQPTIVKPLKDSPAERAGVLAGARILEVNGQSVAGWPVDKVVEEIRGEVGTEVKLTLLHICRDTLSILQG